ncbi:MAG TPA: hypothetical protein VJN96_13000 [Vicinamibacterales bacterium]|nr:hypothetical protein [Vicinamibacterales bacterium]
MSIESTPPNLPSLTGVTIYRAEGPRGLLRIATHSDTSMLAERLYQLWRNDGLPELAGALAVERDHFLSTGKTFCHQVAFEFAYGSFVIIGEPEHPALRDWKWCVGATVGRDTHSWIEHLGEAFDSAMVQVDGKPEQVLWVRQASELRSFYQAVAIEARTFKDFVDWMGAPRGKLFKRHPVVARIAADMRRAAIDSGRVQFRGA